MSCWGVEYGAGVPVWHVPEDFYGQAEVAPTTSPTWDDTESRDSEYSEVARWKRALRREYHDVVHPFLFALDFSTKSGKGTGGRVEKGEC